MRHSSITHVGRVGVGRNQRPGTVRSHGPMPVTIVARAVHVGCTRWGGRDGVGASCEYAVSCECAARCDEARDRVSKFNSAASLRIYHVAHVCPPTPTKRIYALYCYSKNTRESKRQNSVEIIHSILLDLDSATKIEQVIHDACRLDPNQKKYSQKIRSIIYNLKSNEKFREDILQKNISIEDLPHMRPADIDSTLWDPIFNKAARKRKINEIINRIAA